MTVDKSHVYLYAAIENDYVKCLAAADVTGLSYSHCIGDFEEAWRLTADSANLVIAVGGAALYALYYNPCNWPNPAGEAEGHTPFALHPSSQGIAAAKANYFANAGGYTALDSLKLAVMLTYYALHGTYPSGYGGLPRQEIPQQVCVQAAKPILAVARFVDAPAQPPTVTQPSVGVYASITTQSDVQRAVQLGWPGVGVTTALGIPNAPYTNVLPNQPDVAVAQGLAQTGAELWWLSFWTVSWPNAGNTFYQAGFDAGQYAAQQIDAYPGKRRPNYVILDPEGYNQPAQTPSEFQDFVRGFATGVTSVNASLQPAFYANQSQYTSFQLSQLNYPAFIAIAPIDGNLPTVTGGQIKGYIAYYASCPVDSDIAQVKAWGGLYNTVQFRDSGIDCGPA